MIETVLRFKAKDDKTARDIMQRFFNMCVEEPKVCGWGVLDVKEE